MKRTVVLIVLLLIAVVALVVKTSGQDEYSRNEKHRGAKWEYLVVAGPSTSNFMASGNPRMRKDEGSFGREAFVLEQHLDKLGSQGWELINVVGNEKDPVFYFKRPK